MGVGTQDQTRSTKIIESGRTQLACLVGEQQAANTVDDMKKMSSSLNLPDNAFTQDTWDIQEQQNKLNSILSAAVNSDQVIGGINKIVHKYNHHSALYRVSNRVATVSLSVVGLTPTFAGPAAQVALLAYIMATGGPEEDKLMSELYLDKRLQSRFDLLNGKAQLALEKYQIGVLTKNPMLLVASQSVVKQLTTEEQAMKVFSCDSSLANSSTIAPQTVPNASYAPDQSDSTFVPPATKDSDSHVRMLARRLKAMHGQTTDINQLSVPALSAIPMHS
jgi:hypothetical protein